jgi:hypothetical protein
MLVFFGEMAWVRVIISKLGYIPSPVASRILLIPQVDVYISDQFKH